MATNLCWRPRARWLWLQVISELSPVEVELLAAHLESLERTLDPAFNRLNWLSLAIPEFISTCNKVSDVVPRTS